MMKQFKEFIIYNNTPCGFIKKNKYFNMVEKFPIKIQAINGVLAK